MAGYWLDPDTGQGYEVSRHELWVLDPNNAKLAGIPQQTYDAISQMNPVTHADEIRLAAIHAGLIRIRDYRNRTSVQFAVPQNRVRQTLWAAYMFLVKVCQKYASISIDNLANNDHTEIDLEDLGKKLVADETVMREEVAEFTDLSASSFQKYVERREAEEAAKKE